MIKIENVDVHGWEAAIRGARNPMNSWNQSDTSYGTGEPVTEIGARDLKLLRNLAKAGPDHGKYLRMITVTMDVTAPLYWWKEFDTYKVGTVANSCSTMHKIHAKEFTLDDFSHEHLFNRWGKEHDDEIVCFDGEYSYTSRMVLTDVIIPTLNHYRDKFRATNDKAYWWQMIQLLPSSYNQRRTVFLSYAVLKAMYHARCLHKLDEWREFCKFIKTLPHSELITGEDE